ncbi:uncharacterized protein LOC105276645 isoform X2 [Ooceraea biroi]|nr:uncharacterized protein LOC105276645 isoform X2 [Ooceraea biroi]
MESVVLLKQKVCKTHQLIFMYSEKLKENDRVKSDLAIAKKEAKRVIYDYKSALDKIRELELRITKAKQINEELTNKMNDNDVENTANKQVIEQLTYKIGELEEKHSNKIMEYELNKSSFEERVKSLEQELKKSELKLKRMGKKVITNDMNTVKHDIKNQSTLNLDTNVSLCDDKLNCQPTVERQDKSIMTDDSAFKSTSCIGIQSTSDIGVNTSLCELNAQSKCETQDKNIMTDEFYNTANYPCPLFCAQCKVHLPQDRMTEKIYKTMNTYPKLIDDGDVMSPSKEDSLIPYSSSDTYSDLMNKDVASPKVLRMSHASSSDDQCDDSIVISEAAHSTMIQSCKNVESRDTNTTAYVPAATNLPNNLNLISATINLPENTNCTRESFHSNSNDSLIKQSLSIKKIKKQLKALESKIKKFPKLKKKRNISSCHHCEYRNGTSLSPNLITAICKGVLQYSNDRVKNTWVRNEGKKLRRHKKHGIKKKEKLKKRKERLKKYNAREDSWESESFDEDTSRDILCNRLDDVARENKASQFEHSIPYTTIQNINKNNSVLDVNTSDRPVDNESDEESNLWTRENQESVSHLMEVTSAIASSDVIINEISTNDNSLREDNREYIDIDNQMATKTTVFLSNSQKSVDHANSNIIMTESEIKGESKIKKSIASRLLKKIRNLKRKTQANSHMNKEQNSLSCIDTSEHHELTKLRIEGQRTGIHPAPLKSIINLKRKSKEMLADLSIDMQENSESHSGYRESIKKKRIAHVPKSSSSSIEVLQSSNIQNDLAHHTQKIAAILETSQQKRDESEQLDTQIQENDSSIENEKSHTVKKNTDGEEENSTNNGDLNTHDDNFPPSNMNIEQASMTVEFDKCDNVAVDSIIDENTNASASAGPLLPNAKIIAQVSNSRDKSVVSSNDISYNTMKNFKCERLPIPSTNVQLKSPSSPSADSIHDCNEDVEENIQIKQIEEVTPTGELEHTCDTNAEKNSDNAAPCDTVLNDDRISLLNQSSALKVSHRENHDGDCISPRLRHLPISRDNRVFEDCLSRLRKDFTNTPKNAAILEKSSQQKRDESKQLDTQIQENGSSIEKEKNHMAKKRNEKNTVKYNKVHGPDNKPDEENSNNGDLLNDNNFSPSNMNVEQASMIVEFDSCDNVAVNSIIDENTNASASAEPLLLNAKIIAEVSNSRDKLHVSSNDISHNKVNNLEDGRLNVPSINIQLESPSYPSEDWIHDCNEDVGEDIQIKQIGIVEEVTPTDELKQTCDTNAENYVIPCNTVLNDNRLSNVSPRENHDSKCMPSRDRSPISRDNLGNRVIEDRVGKIPRENVGTNQREEVTKCTDVPYDNVEESGTLISWFVKYINEKPIKPKISRKQMKHISTITDNFVKKELEKLANSAWEDTVYHEVLQNLTSTCGSRIIAKCIIEFLSENKNKNILDNSFTPPAPLMTTLEQKFTTLLVDLEVSRPMIIHFVQAGIQYKLFRLNSDVKNLNVVDTLTRMYVILSRIQKDREKIRIMCCDALYCMNLKAISVLYIVLTCWSEVLPKADTNIGILPKCIAFLIGWQQIDELQKSAKRSKALKLLIVAFYKYVYSQETINDLLEEFTSALKVKQTDGLDTAIILIAKKQGPSWIYNNFICSTLLPMIINHEHPCVYDGFCLLGRMLRAFPSTAKVVQDIINQLHDLIKSEQGSHDQQEGVISALLSLSKQKFDVVASCVLQWTPSTPLRPSTIMQLEAFIRLRKKAFWKSHLKLYKSVKNKN